MKNKISIGFIALSLFVVAACSDSNTEITNTSISTSSSESTVTNGVNADGTVSQDSSETNTTKTDAEYFLEGGKLIINAALDEFERQRLKDSINNAHKEKMYAYKIGVQYSKEKDAYKAYNKLIDANVTSVYVFKAKRKEYYIVRFEAKGVEELEESKEDFKIQLGENGTEGIKVINLNDLCSKKETVTKFEITEDKKEIKCLECN